MIISHRFKFIFIKTVKTAGTSIEVFLSQHCAEEDVVTPIWPHIESHRPRNYKTPKNMNDFKNHNSAASIKKRVSTEIWDSYFKFCVERNPWDKTLSHYHMMNDQSEGIPFSDYMEQGNFCINFPTYTDANGNLLVDRVIKYEALAEELGSVFNDLGIPFNGSLGVHAKSEHRKDRRPYQEVFSAKHKTKIETAFAREIEMHGYQF